MDRINANELIVFLIRETGWPIDYIVNHIFKGLPVSQFNSLIEELKYQKAIDDYKLALHFGSLLACWTSDKSHRRKASDFTGEMPKRAKGGINLMAQPRITKLILADGNEYEFAPLDLNMLIEMEDRFNLPFAKLIEEGKVAPIRQLLFLMAKEKHPDLTEEKLGKLVTAEIMVKAYEAITNQIG